MRFVEVKTKAQVETVAALAKIIWNEHYLPIIGQEQIDYMLKKFQSYEPIARNIKEDGYIYYLFYLDETPFGYMAMHPRDGKLFLSKLYIHKDFRGHGYSSKAFHFVEEYARQYDLSSVWLTCSKDNSASLAIYERRGFKKVREIQQDIGGGFIMDDYVLEKDV